MSVFQNYPPESIAINPVEGGWKLSIVARTYADAERFSRQADTELREELERQKPRTWQVLVSCDGKLVTSPRSDTDLQTWFCKQIKVQEVK